MQARGRSGDLLFLPSYSRRRTWTPSKRLFGRGGRLVLPTLVIGLKINPLMSAAVDPIKRPRSRPRRRLEKLHAETKPTTTDK